MAESASHLGESLRLPEVADSLFEALSRKITPVSFVQVGAHDGVSGDPIHRFIRRHGWVGILVEPVPYLFERLQQNYRNVDGLIFENVCVAPTEGIAPFYHMKQRDPEPLDWYSQLSSFRKDVILKHRQDIPDIESYIQEIAIATLPLETLVARHRVRLDALIVDTEGFDAKVLSSIDLQSHNPFVIYFEYKHLPADEASDILQRLKSLDYIIFTDGDNVVAAKPVILPDDLLPIVMASETGILQISR